MSDPQTPPVTTPENADSMRAILDQARALWKYRYLAFAIAALTAALVALWVLRQPRVYAATISIEFDPSPPRPLGREVDEIDAEASFYWATQEYYTTQHYVIQSQRVAEGVVRQLGLQHDPEFLGVSSEARRNFRSIPILDAALALRGRIAVAPVKDSRLVRIVIEDVSPRRAQLLANTIAAVYIRQNLESKLSTTISALEWLGQQLDSLRNQLELSELALHDYRRNNNLLSISYEDHQNHVGNRIVKLSESLTDAQIRRIGVEARVAELRRATTATDPLASHAPALLQSSALAGLRSAYEGVRRDREAMAVRYGERWEPLQMLDQRLAEIRDAIRHEVRNILTSAEAELREVRRGEGALRSALAEAQQEGLELNLKEIQYGRLLRERDNNAKLYQIILERTKETDLTRLSRVNNVRVLDEAMLPGAPIKPKTTLLLAAGVFGGLFLGLLVAAVITLLDRTVRFPRDIEDELKATFLGLIPRIESGRRGGYRYRYGYTANDAKEPPIVNPDMVVHTHPNSPVAEACRMIRTNLTFMAPDSTFHTLMVASGDPREGKSTVAICIALTLAQTGKRTLLVDTDLRRPRVHKAFKVRPPVGITSVLVGESSFDDAVIETEIPNLSIMTCGPLPPNPAELLQSHKFADFIELAKSKYDRVVFDTPPVGIVSDALSIAVKVDAVVMVVRARSTVRARAAGILAQLRVIGARIAGVILNDVQIHKEVGGGYYYTQYEYGQSDEAA